MIGGVGFLLKRERRFLDIIRNGIKNGISILEITLKELRDEKKRQEEQIKNGRDPQLQKKYFEVITEMQTIQFLIDAMQFAKWKIKTIEKRIKKGEKLEKSDYAGQHLKEFLQTLEDEKKIDMELALVLEGKSKEVKKIWNYVTKDRGAWGSGVISAPITAGLSYAGTPYFHNVLGVSSPADSVEGLVATIIGVSIAIVAGLAYSTRHFEESRRNLGGEVGDIIKIPK